MKFLNSSKCQFTVVASCGETYFTYMLYVCQQSPDKEDSNAGHTWKQRTKKEQYPGVLLTNDRAAWRRMHVRGSHESKSETQGTL